VADRRQEVPFPEGLNSRSPHRAANTHLHQSRGINGEHRYKLQTPISPHPLPVPVILWRNDRVSILYSNELRCSRLGPTLKKGQSWLVPRRNLGSLLLCNGITSNSQSQSLQYTVIMRGQYQYDSKRLQIDPVFMDYVPRRNVF